MFEVILEYRVDGQRVASILLLLAALKWGRPPEKASIITFVALFTIPLTIVEYAFDGPLIFSERGILYAALDVLALISFLSIGLNANRVYPLWLAAFQIVVLAAHMVRGVVEAITPLAYAIMVISPSYFQLGIIAGGLILHIRRKKRFGEYRDWRMSAPQQPWTLSESGSGPRGGI